MVLVGSMQIKLNKEKNMVERVKIIDFGFAVFQEALKNMNIREKYAGTPGYLAPEILLMKEYDETVDNFSLGVILYFMLSGILPFHSLIQEEIVSLTLRCSVSLCNNHWANVSANVYLFPYSGKGSSESVVVPQGNANTSRLGYQASLDNREGGSRSPDREEST